MTNKELLTAELLDIVFDGRNKEYGAYALRKNYDRRMKYALTIGLSSVMMVFLLCSFASKRKGKVIIPPTKYDTLVLIERPPATPDLPKPKIIPPPARHAAATIDNTTIRIVDDNQVPPDANIPTNADMQDAQSGLQTSAGASDGSGTDSNQVIGSDPAPTTPPVPDPPALPDAPPQFPGGMEALKLFLSKHLTTPEELGEGETRLVKARFRVDEDGVVSFVEIIGSGGNSFDKEVLRVCKKMPRWKPAIQHGKPATMTYVLPVTFITTEP